MTDLDETEDPAAAAARYRAALGEIDAYAGMVVPHRAAPEPGPPGFPWPALGAAVLLLAVAIALICATLQL